MKKLTALLLALLMITGAACASSPADENAHLTQEELEMYLSILPADALAEGVEETHTDEATGLTSVSYAHGARLFIADETLEESSAVLGAILNTEQEDLRGIHWGESLADVLSVYPNDNAELAGTRYDAVLYVSGGKPEATLGYVLRDGQRVTEVTHLVFTWKEEGVVRAGVTYTFDQDAVSGIHIFGLDGVIEEEEALQQLSDATALQSVSEFIPYASSALGEGMAPFGPDDLAFSGLDVTALAPENAIAVLGQPQVDEWMEDGQEHLRTLQWEGISIIFLYKDRNTFLHLDSLTVNDDVLEGPRGVRIDDAMDSVMNRFLHGSNQALTNAVALYGDGETAPYGVLAYSENTATLTYVQALESGTNVIWQLTFVRGQLQSYRMLLR